MFYIRLSADQTQTKFLKVLPAQRAERQVLMFGVCWGEGFRLLEVFQAKQGLNLPYQT